MAKHARQATCSQDGCNKSAHWLFDTLQEAREHAPKRNNWKCLRHKHPDKQLSALNPQIRKVLTAETVESSMRPGEYLEGHFWNGSNGFVSGPGFQAYADDFPEGTKLVVTAELVFPEETDP